MDVSTENFQSLRGEEGVKQLPHAQGFCEGFSQTQQGKWDSGRLCNQWFFPAPEKGQIDLNIQIKTCNRMGHEIQYLQN